MPASVTARPMALARPVASSKRASGVRTPSLAACFALRRSRRYGPMTIARSTSPLAGGGLRRGADLLLRGSNRQSRFLGNRRLLGAFKELDRLSRHDCRYGVLIDELRVPISAQQHAEIVEPGDNAL